MKERKSWDGSGGEIRTKLFGFFEIINSPVLEILSFSFKRRFQPGQKGVVSFLLQERNEKKEEGKEREKTKSCVILLCRVAKGKQSFLSVLPRDRGHLPSSGFP